MQKWGCSASFMTQGGVVFCLLPGPESHTEDGVGLSCRALTQAHSKMRPPSGMAILAEAGILYRVVPLS